MSDVPSHVTYLVSVDEGKFNLVYGGDVHTFDTLSQMTMHFAKDVRQVFQLPEDELEKHIKKLGLGATGRHPHGKLTESDEGELKAALAAFDGQVVIVFGKPVEWLSLGPQEAVQMAELLIKRAREMATEPLVEYIK